MNLIKNSVYYADLPNESDESDANETKRQRHQPNANSTSTSAAASKGRKDLKNLIKKNVQSKKFAEEITLKATQLKILRLVGYFGEFVQLSDNDHSGLHKDKRFLKFEIPFQDCKPELFIGKIKNMSCIVCFISVMKEWVNFLCIKDDLLPRVLKLCENSVERQTRISACEFFHAVALIFIGKCKILSNSLIIVYITIRIASHLPLV